MFIFYLKRNTGLEWVKEQFLKTPHDSRKPSEKSKEALGLHLHTLPSINFFHLLITAAYSLNDGN